METIKISDEALRKGAEEGMDGFLQVFIDKYLEVTGGVINAETMPLLNGYQHTLLGYHFLREELNEGGFVQLIQNGYGPYIFDNPFAKAMRLFGLKDFSKLRRFMMPTKRTWKRKGMMMSLWLCMNNTKNSMIWRKSSWIWKNTSLPSLLSMWTSIWNTSVK